MLELQAHPISKPSDSAVKVNYHLGSDHLLVEFDVITHKMYTNNKYTQESWDNWGLWDTDVVEVFIKKDALNLEYLELQVSPLNQKFALLIKKPREDFSKASPKFTKIESLKTDKGFRARFVIDYKDIPGEGNELFANFHACLGPTDKREYFSFNLNPEANPDFHRPEYFKSIGKII